MTTFPHLVVLAVVKDIHFNNDNNKKKKNNNTPCISKSGPSSAYSVTSDWEDDATAAVEFMSLPHESTKAA
eukprot:350764-Amphidinium_carterae.1